MRFSLTITCLIVLAITTPFSAKARSFQDYAPTTPLLYRYAACVLDGSKQSSEEQIAQCANLKAELLAESESVIERFYTSGRSDVRRELGKGFDEIEKDAEQSRKKSKPVPGSIIGYLQCMGEGVMATQDYKAGDAVSYIGIEEPCYTAHITVVPVDVTKQELDNIRHLHRRFQRFGRLTYPVARTRSNPFGNRLLPRGATDRSNYRTRLAPVRVMDRSFLNLSLIKKIENG